MHKIQTNATVATLVACVVVVLGLLRAWRMPDWAVQAGRHYGHLWIPDTQAEIADDLGTPRDTGRN